MGFSEHLKAERLRKGLKQRELANMVKTTNTSISNWEKGISRPSASVISLLAQALEVSPFDLLGNYSLRDIRELDSKDPSERTFEDSMALTFSVDLLKTAGIEFSNLISDTIDNWNRDIKELGSAIQTVCWERLLNDGGEQLLFAYDSLNSSGKVFLLEYLTGLLRVPTYLEEPVFGVDEEQITELMEIKGNLKKSK